MPVSSQSVLPASTARTAGVRLGANRWAMLALPSLSDLFFFSILAWLIGPRNLGWLGLLGDCDTGWHIRTGDWILQHGTVPRVDLFSFSKQGQSWFAWEWLSDVLFSVLHSSAGLKGIVLFAALVLCTVAWLVLRECVRESGNGFIALVVTLMATGAATVHFLARPHILTMLLLAVSMALLRADRRRPGRLVWLLVPLTVLWTNVHGGFVAILACLGILVVGTAVEAWIGGAGRLAGIAAAMRYGKLLAACTVATLVNPYGIGLHRHIAEYLGGDWIKKVVQEFQSPSFRSENMYQLEALLMISVVTAGFLMRRRRVVEALWILFWAHQTLVSVRHAPLFLIVAAPAVAREIAGWWRSWVARYPEKSIPRIIDALSVDILPALRRTSVWIVAPLLVLGFLVHDGWPEDFPPEIFPVKMVNRHPEIAGQRTFTSDQWADYLIYRFYPHQRVYFDGRSDFYGEKIGRQYQRLSNGEWQWRSILDRNHFRYALVSPSWPVASLLKISPGWSVVEDDGKSVLFERIGTGAVEMAVRDSRFPANGLMKSAEPAERVEEDSSR
ncbi:MAG: hypothetical protein IT160_13240 [Bryobacterales bacterium]|nr:hypothetical protein [Bryobacterales bacterium]